MADTLVTQNLVVVDEVETKDATILMGLDNPSDNVNLGIIEEFNDGVRKYSGLLRDRVTKRQYLIENSPIRPDTTTNINILPRGNLVVDQLDSITVNGANINSSEVKTADLKITDDLAQTKWQVFSENSTNNFIIDDENNSEFLRFNQNNGRVKISGSYFLDANTGNQGQVLTLSNVSGDVALWQNNDLQTTYDNSTSPQITTNPSIGQPIFKISQGTPTLAGDPFFQLEERFGNVLLSVTNSTFEISSMATLSIGDLGTQYTFPKDNLAALNGDALVYNNGSLEFAQISPTLSDLAYANIGFQTQATTILSAQNIWAQINGVYSAYELSDFTQLSGILTYTGTDTTSFVANLSVSWESPGLTRAYSIGIFKNGTLITGSEQGASLNDTGNYPRNAATVCITELQTNDTISFHVRNLQDGEDVIFHAVSATVTKIGNSASGGGGNPFDQNLNTTDNVKFAEVGIDTTINWRFDGSGSQLFLENDGGVGKYTFSQFSFIKNRSDDSPTGVTDLSYKSRGSLSVPSAINVLDDIKTTITFGHDGTVFQTASEIKTSATQNWTGLANGSKMTFSTVDNNTVGPVQKIKLDVDGLSVGGAGLEYAFPPDNSTGNDGDTLVYNSNLDILEFKPLTGFKPYALRIPKTVNNTSVETDITDASLSLALPANSIEPRSVFRVTILGLMQTANSLQIISFRLKFGGSTVAGRLLATLPALGSLQYFKCEIYTTFINDGINSIGVFTSNLDHGIAGSSGGQSGNNFVNVNSTVVNNISVTAQWVLANANNNLTVNNLIIEKVS